MESCNSIVVDETLLTGGDVQTSVVDERTLACTPAPVAASTVTRAKRSQRRILAESYGSFLNNHSASPIQEDDNGSDIDRSSLGLLPSNCLLDAENDLLRRDVICLSGSSIHLEPPAEVCCSSNSQKNGLLDSGSSRDQTSDSQEPFTTVKKCPQVAAGSSACDKRRYLPQALFQSVEEVNESGLNEAGREQSSGEAPQNHSNKFDVEEQHQITDSGVGQTNFTSSQQSRSSSASAFDVHTLKGGETKEDLHEKTLIQQDGTDHTFCQVKKAEDLEKLDGTFLNFKSAPSDKEKAYKEMSNTGSDKLSGQSSVTEKKEMSPNRSLDNVNSYSFPVMDGPFKIPALPSRLMAPGKNDPENEDSSFSGHKLQKDISVILGDSIPFYQSGSVEEWGPSIEFGDSIQIRESEGIQTKDWNEKNNSSSRNKKNWRGEPDGERSLRTNHSQRNDNSPESLKSDSDDCESRSKTLTSSKFREYAAQSSSKEWDALGDRVRAMDDFPVEAGSFAVDKTFSQTSHNPFGDFGDAEDVGEGFEDEEFKADADAAAAILDADEMQFIKDNPIMDELCNTTLGSVRLEDQTFLNMTIGTYMATRSGELGSLTSKDKRPEFGILVRSPPTVRPTMPLLLPEQISRSPDDEREIKESGSQNSYPTRSTNPESHGSSSLNQNSLRCTSALDNQSVIRNLSSDWNRNSFILMEKQKSNEFKENLRACSEKKGRISSKTPLMDTTLTFQEPVSNEPSNNQSEVWNKSSKLDRNSFLLMKQQKSGKYKENLQDYNVKKVRTISKIPLRNTNSTFQKPVSGEPVKNLDIESPLESTKEKGTHQGAISSPVQDLTESSFIASQLSLAKLSDNSMTSASTEVTFNSFHKMFDRSDLSFSDPASLFLSEFNRKRLVKEEAQRLKKKPDEIPVKDVQDDDIKKSGRQMTCAEADVDLEKERTIMDRKVGEPPVGKSVTLQSKISSSSSRELSPPLKQVSNPLLAQATDIQATSRYFTIAKGQPQQENDKDRSLQTRSAPIKPNASLQHGNSGKAQDRSLVMTAKTKQSMSEVNLLQTDSVSAQFVKWDRSKVNPQTVKSKASLPQRTYISEANCNTAINDEDSLLMPPPTTKLPPQAGDYSKDYGNNTLESVTINSHNSTSFNIPLIELSLTQLPILQKDKSPKQNLLPPAGMMQTSGALSHDHLRQLQNIADDSTVCCGEEELDTMQFHTLLPDNTSSMLHQTEVHSDFISSTPLNGCQPTQKFSFTQISEKSILPLVTPRVVSNLLEVPDIVQMPEACCIHLSQQTTFPLHNLLDRGVKCLLTFREVTYMDQRLDGKYCPFELKRQVILSPGSTQTVQVIFRPRQQGKYIAVIEVFSQNMTNPQENRTYTLNLVAYAEFPVLKIQPHIGEIDFGDLLWGKTACQAIKIQNMGQATLPLRFSIFRKESSLCNFSFYPENSMDISTISLTPRPAAVNSVFSLSLEGLKEGRPVSTDTINVYCRAKEPDSINQIYKMKAEKFQAVLTVHLDTPIEGFQPLYQIGLYVTIGMYKLHVDRDILSISTPPEKTGHGTINIINSGNIPMPVNILFEPERDHFTLSTTHMVIPAGSNCPVQVTFTPPPTREHQDENRVNLILKNHLTQHFVSVIGKIKATETKIGVTSTTVNFEGVDIGQRMKQKFSFCASSDDNVKVWINNPGVFKLLNEDGEYVDSLDIAVRKDTRHTVWLIFCPARVEGYSADLVLQILYANRYSVPISGYGGHSSLKVEKVTQNEAGERWLDLGSMEPRTSIIRKILLTNTGLRSCFVKTTIYDNSGLELPPQRATVMPSVFLLPPGESTDVHLKFDTTHREAETCRLGRALVACVKLAWGDDIMRQQFLSNPGKQNRHLIGHYDIPLSIAESKIVDAEMKGICLYGLSYQQFKKSMSVIKIGLFGQSVESQSSFLPSTLPKAGVDTKSSTSPHRPALSVVSQNIQPAEQGKDAWTVEPTEIQLNVVDIRTEDFVQIINYSAREVNFTVEHDQNLIVLPFKGTISPKNTTMLNVQVNPEHFPKKELKASCGLIQVHCLQQIKYIKVFMNVTSNYLTTSLSPKVKPRSPPAKASASATQGHTSLLPAASVSLTSPLQPSKGNVDQQAGGRIHGSNMTIFPTTEAGTKTEMMYVFTNLCTEPLKWEIAAFAPAYVKHADNTSSVYRVNYEVFKLSPLTGVLQSDETQKVFIEFSPQLKGSYNQAWSIHDTSDDQVTSHRFTVYAKASTNSLLDKDLLEQDQILPGLSRTLNPTSPRHGPSHSNRMGAAQISGEKQREQVVSSPRDPHVVSYVSDLHLPANMSQNTHKPRMSKSKKPEVGFKYPNSDTVNSMSGAVIAESTTAPALNSGISWSAIPPPLRDETSLGSGKVDHSARTTPVPLSNNITYSSFQAEVPSAEMSVNTTSASPPSTRRLDATGENSPRNSKSVSSPNYLVVEQVIVFPQLHIGDSDVMKICVSNSANEDVQVVVQSEPKPPFMIKHHNFTVRKSKRILFPITFKPRHISRFRDKVVFRETRTGTTFTTVLEAECVG